MKKNLYVVFVAGGNGTRMGLETPKQFLDLCGAPVLQRTIERFLEAVPGMKAVVVLPTAHIATWKELCEKNRFEIPQMIVEGGITRFHSVKNALSRIPDGAMVMIQDGVRPLASVDLIRRVLDASGETRCVIPASPVTDTLKTLVKSGTEGEWVSDGTPDPDRSRLFGAQTPQIYPSEVLKDAYSLGFNPLFTDDASVARAKEIPLTYIEGQRYNIKITTREDLELARLLLGR